MSRLASGNIQYSTYEEQFSRFAAELLFVKALPIGTL